LRIKRSGVIGIGPLGLILALGLAGAALSQSASIDLAVGQSVEIPVQDYRNHALGVGGEAFVRTARLENGVRVTGVAVGEATLHVFSQDKTRREYHLRVTAAGLSPETAAPGEASKQPAPVPVSTEAHAASSDATVPSAGVVLAPPSVNFAPAAAKPKASMTVSGRPAAQSDPARPRRLTAAEREAQSRSLEAAIGHPGIKVTVTDTTIALTGTVASEAERERAGRLAELLGAARVTNRVEVKVPPAADAGVAGGPAPGGDVGLTPQLTADLAMLAQTGGETPVRLVIEQGRSHILSTGESISKVIIADGEIVSAQVISARQAMLIGQKPGKTDAYLLVEQYPDDPVGALQRYEVEVPAPPAPPESAEAAPAGPPPVDPEALRMEIEDALTDFPAVTVSVLSREGSGQSTLILRGEVPTAEDVQHIGEIAALFGGTVLNHTHAPAPPAASLPPDIEALRAVQEQKLTQLLQTALGEEAAAIRVQVRERGVVLLGTVRSDRSRQRAEQIVDALADWQTIEIIAPRLFESGGTQRTSGGNSEMAILNPAIEGFNRPGRRGGSSRTGAGAGGRGTGETAGIVNLLEVVGDVQQVMTNAKIVEIDRNALTKLGIEWGTFEPSSGTTTAASSQPRVGKVTIGESNGVGGPIQRLSGLVGTLEMLEDSGKAHTLASPDLLALEGTRADFVVGGQVPIPTSSIGAGGGGGGGNTGFATQSVEFKPYGVLLSVLPEATEGGHVVMQVRVEVSTPDFANAIVFQGTTLPGFRLRQATQSVAVKDGDTIVLGGLLSKEDQTQIQKIPFLSEIPFLGELFKKRTFKNGETELVIFLTPHIVAWPASAETLEQTESLRDAERLDAPEVQSSFGGGGGTGGGTGGTGGTGR